MQIDIDCHEFSPLRCDTSTIHISTAVKRQTKAEIVAGMKRRAIEMDQGMAVWFFIAAQPAYQDKTTMTRYYILVRAEEILPNSSGHPWPYEVSICFDGVPLPVVVAEGVAHGAALTTLSAAEALQAQWQAHFAKSKAAWLLPMIRRMASGEPVAADEGITAYKALHGQEPSSYEVPA
jgi:hypothetical protein